MTKHGTGSTTRTLRTSPAELREWQRLADAEGIPLNKWLRRAVNDAAALERTLAAMKVREADKG